ncbi:MAG TPA: SDR family oxidoreductase, partial [Candidatus Tumulicola sp.]|nr:SDR family oxidoreductase [Candidatus Tumulicola sp.]
TSTGMWERILATNLTGTFLCTREAVEDMIVAKAGRIVNVASIAGLAGAPYIAAYCASKHGVVGFTRAIAAEFEGTGITANAVCPGYTETDMMRKALGNIVKHTGAEEDAARAQLARSNPEGRIATVEEVADAVVDLILGDRTGAAVVVPGGVVA